MKKILIEIKKDALILSYNYKIETDIKDLMNTNIISDNKLMFSDEYILENPKILGSFIKDLINQYNLKRIIISNFEILSIIKDSLKLIENIDTLYISDESNFTYEAYEIITKLKKFKKVDCYSIPIYMIDLFDKNKIELESRQEILYTSNFMEENNLVSYTKIYYKSSIKIAPPLNEQDYLDFNSFIKINRYLKTINFNACSIESLDNLTKILIENRVKNIKIIINDNITKKYIIKDLKKRKKLLAKYNIELDLRYTKEYVKKNFLKQVISTTLALCAVFVIAIASGSTIFVMLNNMQSEQNVADIKSRIEQQIASVNMIDINSEKEEEITQEPAEENQNEEIKEFEAKAEEDGFIPAVPLEEYMIPKMKSLLELNNDTVGCLLVPGTNIDYPVVKTNDNDYYLEHNYDKKKDYNGWVYMNASNNPKDLDQNTIIFAHNRFYSGVMFGTLSNLTKPNWYNEASNISIYFNTMYEELEWEVFSIYKVNVTDDYLKTNFDSDDEFNSFINTVKERSIFESNKEITSDDKILTLSTCVENDARLVVHAVLRK